MYFGEYESVGVIGHGATGYVYKVRRGDEIYALKACTSVDTNSLKRFDREIRIAQSINHPNIIHVFDYDLSASNPYFVMELCDDPIGNVISEKPLEKLLSLAIQICEGVKALHDNGILHRDIKPNNILTKAEEVKITDFGFGAFLNHDSTTLTNSIIGTPGYIAPEVYSGGGHQATKLSDIYSLGCVFGYLFSNGVSPEYYKPQDVSPAVAHIVEKCREKNPEGRYSDVQEIIDELRNLQEPIRFLSIRDLFRQEDTIAKVVFYTNAFQILIKNKRWDELISDLRLLGTRRLIGIIENVPEAESSLLLLLESVYNNDTDIRIQFEDVDHFVDFCAIMFNHTTDVLVKEKVIEMSLGLVVTYNRYSAMRIVIDKMLNKLTDEELRQLSCFLKTKKDLFNSLEESLGEPLPRRVKMVIGNN